MLRVRSIKARAARRISSATRASGDTNFGVNQGNNPDRKSTRLNSSHSQISYAVFCLKKKTTESESIPPSSAYPPASSHLSNFAYSALSLNLGAESTEQAGDPFVPSFGLPGGSPRSRP